MAEITPAGFRSTQSQVPVSSNQEKRLKIKEFISWSVCFAIVSGLTGLMIFLKVGVTMESITSSLFFLSLAGLIYFVSKIILLSRSQAQGNTHSFHELN